MMCLAKREREAERRTRESPPDLTATRRGKKTPLHGSALVGRREEAPAVESGERVVVVGAVEECCVVEESVVGWLISESGHAILEALNRTLDALTTQQQQCRTVVERRAVLCVRFDG
jgi:hypothetical protein